MCWIAPIRPQCSLLSFAWNSHWPVNDKTVNIVQFQIFKGCLQIRANMFRPVVAIPKLWLNEQILPKINRSLGITFLPFISFLVTVTFWQLRLWIIPQAHHQWHARCRNRLQCQGTWSQTLLQLQLLALSDLPVTVMKGQINHWN